MRSNPKPIPRTELLYKAAEMFVFLWLEKAAILPRLKDRTLTRH
jgi:hypothetical protein